MRETVSVQPQTRSCGLCVTKNLAGLHPWFLVASLAGNTRCIVTRGYARKIIHPWGQQNPPSLCISYSGCLSIVLPVSFTSLSSELLNPRFLWGSPWDFPVIGMSSLFLLSPANYAWWFRQTDDSGWGSPGQQDQLQRLEAWGLSHLIWAWPLGTGEGWRLSSATCHWSIRHAYVMNFSENSDTEAWGAILGILSHVDTPGG